MCCRQFIANLYLTIIVCLLFQKLDAVVIDACPDHTVNELREQLLKHRLSAIFYYTSWSDESLDGLRVYQQVVRYFAQYIYFTKVNCWYKSCNCTGAYRSHIGSGSPDKWPTLIVHYGQHGYYQMQYNGNWKFHELCYYFNQLLGPLERIQNANELNQIYMESDAVVIGLYRQPYNNEYRQYFLAAIKWLEVDHLRAIRFLVSFDQQLINSIFDYKAKNVTRLTLPLLAIATHGKVRKVFGTKRGFVWSAANIVLGIQRELRNAFGALLTDHGINTPITLAKKLMTQQTVLAVFTSDRKFFQYLEGILDMNQKFSSNFLICQAAERLNYRNFKCVAKENVLKLLNMCQTSDGQITGCYHSIQFMKSFTYLKYYYEINEILHEYFRCIANPQSDYHAFIKDDEYSLSTAAAIQHGINCALSDILYSTALRIAIAKNLEEIAASVRYRYNSNDTMSATIMDKDTYVDYLQSLGVPNATKATTVVFIANNNNTESVYLMTNVFRLKYFSDFLHNYYTNNLKALQRNSLIKQDYSNDDLEEDGDSFKLQELNRSRFLHLLHNEDITTVVLFYSPICALCGNMQHTFLQLAAMLRYQTNIVRFFRMNVQDNDLPWQYDMSKLPTLLVFPKHRFADSRPFPTHLKADVRNLLFFILSQIDAIEQIEIVIGICQSGAMWQQQLSCWNFAETLLTQHMEEYLHYSDLYNTEDERTAIFQSLRAFNIMNSTIQKNLRLV